MLRLTRLALRSALLVDSGCSRRPLRSTPRADCTDACSSLVELDVKLGSLYDQLLSAVTEILWGTFRSVDSELTCELLRWVPCVTCGGAIVGCLGVRSGFKLCCVPVGPG